MKGWITMQDDFEKIAEQTVGAVFSSFSKQFESAFRIEVDRGIKTGRGRGAALKEYYHDYFPRRRVVYPSKKRNKVKYVKGKLKITPKYNRYWRGYKRTYNLFNNLYKVTSANVPNPSNRYYYNRRISIIFDAKYLHFYMNNKKRDVRPLVFWMSFMHGSHGPLMFFGLQRRGKPLSPPPVERAKQYMKERFHALAKKESPKLRKAIRRNLLPVFKQKAIEYFDKKV